MENVPELLWEEKRNGLNDVNGTEKNLEWGEIQVISGQHRFRGLEQKMYALSINKELRCSSPASWLNPINKEAERIANLLMF